MQNLIDLFAACFVFLLFASVYRKRSTAAVRFWMAGWFCILLHFGALVFRVHTEWGGAVQSIASLMMLIFCGIAFVLSRAETQGRDGPAVAVSLVLGIPWLGTILAGSLPQPWFWVSVVGAYLGAVAILAVSVRLFTRRLQMLCIMLVVAACTLWLTAALHAHDAGVAVEVVLTECFGFNAVLLSSGRKRFSAAGATISFGAVAWGAVWASAELLGRLAPSLVVSPEIWNLPKYLVATGMILTLLDEEIGAAAHVSEQYRLLFASNPHPMWMYDPDTFKFLQVNDAAVAHYGFNREEFLSMTLRDVLSTEQTPELLAKLRDVGPQQLSGAWEHKRKDGSRVQVDVASQLVLRNGRRIMFALMHDVTERQRMHSQLMLQAHHDVLTLLPNRALFEQRFQEALAQAAEASRKVAIFCIDLDRFKQINDSYGHDAGDVCLREVAARITARLGDMGVPARSGGDEFMLFLGNLQNASEAERFATALLADLTATVDVGDGDLELGASLGFAVYPDDGEERERLWRDADAAMYQAKRAGGAQWVRVSYEISSSANEANEIELGLRRALKAGDFEVRYQPQMTMDGRLHSLEALFRSRDPLLRLVAVERMIAIAEESGLIVPLGNWMLEEVCRQCRAWMDEGLAPVQVAINVSPLQLMRFDFSREVARTLERHDLSARMIEFEVTESTVMPDRGGAPHQIATLARMGIRFSVDDFGTGYSSLGRLHQLPVDSLKIDRSFTRRIAEFDGTYPTVEAIIALAHTFGMKVVAEGVETEEQLKLLKTLGCDRVQGFLFSRPLTSHRATEFLRALEDSSAHQVVA